MLEKICNINDQDLEKSIKQLRNYFDTDVERHEDGNYLILKEPENKDLFLSCLTASGDYRNIIKYSFDEIATGETEGNCKIYRISEIDCEELNKFSQQNEERNTELTYDEKLEQLEYIKNKFIECRGSLNPEIEVRIDHVKDKSGKTINPSGSEPYPHICLIYRNDELINRYKSIKSRITHVKEKIVAFDTEFDESKPEYERVAASLKLRNNQITRPQMVQQIEGLKDQKDDVLGDKHKVFYGFIGGEVEYSLRIDQPLHFRIKAASIEDGTLDKIIDSWDAKKEEIPTEEKKEKVTKMSIYLRKSRKHSNFLAIKIVLIGVLMVILPSI